MSTAEPEPPIAVVRAVCAQHNMRSHLVMGPTTRSDVVRVRSLCVRAVAAAHPQLSDSVLADLFAVSRASIHRARAEDRKARGVPFELPCRAWPEAPEAVVRRRLAALPLGFRAALLNGRRTKLVARERWSIITEVQTVCPGVYPSEIANLLGVDRTSVRHAIQKKEGPYANVV